MIERPFRAEYLYNLLTSKQSGDDVDRIGATLFNSKIKLTPYQIEASLFAFKSPLSKGTLLADEVGLGKTIEAGIVIAQLWSEHHRKILVVCPASLERQWASELLEKFNLPSIIMDRKNYNYLKKNGNANPFLIKENIILCSYQMCSSFKDNISLTDFDLCVIDEAHKLRNVWTGKNVISLGLKNALTSTKKLMLTATPIQNGVMDLYGLSSIIDEGIFGDSKIFKEKYQTHYDENVDELKGRIAKYTHRTLRKDVGAYIKFTKRIPVTFKFSYTSEEAIIYEKIRNLLLNSDEDSYLIPNKEKHLLLLILCKLMGSSIHSIVFTLETMKNRLVTLLNTGVDTDITILENDDDLIDEDEEDMPEVENQSADDSVQVVDKFKLQAEINNLSNIINDAKKIQIENKYLALKQAIDYGFKKLCETKANKKILIFTESRRTQQYLYDSLNHDGYKNVLLFNGSNSDETSNQIYAKWCAKTENLEKLKNSKSINMRQAIIDAFEDDGEILIATEAGAEGLNMQFCSMVVNYDLPWNPQVVEQRIGRCHRFGQTHDVVVVNFLNSSNVVEQRIFELLSSKFKVFTEIFGSSDAILGKLESGANLQNSIINIYTKCRTTDEINRAFDELQETYKTEIDATLEKTKEDLLNNFDEDIQQYFSDVMDKANKSVTKVEQDFWDLTKIVLSSGTFIDSKKSFAYEGHNYTLGNKEHVGFVNYNMQSELGTFVMQSASRIVSKYGHIKFDISNYPYKLTNIQEMIGKKGYLAFSKLSIDSFEKEDKLFFNAFLDDGTSIDEDTIIKLFRLDSAESIAPSIDNDAINRIKDDSNVFGKALLLKSEEKNNALLNEEISKINKWAEDKIESTQLSVEAMRNERRNLQKQSDMAENTSEKASIEDEILKLSKKIHDAWISLADSEDEIEIRRKDAITKLRSELMKSSSLTNIFIVSFEII
jgi:ERCC4-related helicase